MFFSTLRFILKGWVEEFYLAPTFHFTYWGFGWVRPLSAAGMYIVFGLLLVFSLCIALGLLYRWSMAAFFGLFTYVELLDKAYYLNHYYFISLLSFLLLFLPAHRAFSLDVWRRPALRCTTVPRWMLLVPQLQLALVYFFAGLAKLKPDWLLAAKPLSIWLQAQVDFPLLGRFFDATWLHYSLSWAAALYDLSIAFFLAWRRSRPLAYLAVLGFHLCTALLFPIGMFPWIMITCTLVFFSPQDYQRLWNWLKIPPPPPTAPALLPKTSPWVLTLLGLFFSLQIFLPLRHWLYPGDVLWTEEGYRFAWNVMLAEKSGLSVFHVQDPTSGRRWLVFPEDYLSPQQAHQMAFQPDMILQFAHFLQTDFTRQGYPDVRITVDAYVSLNGRSSQRLIDPQVDLTQQRESLWPKAWITRPDF